MLSIEQLCAEKRFSTWSCLLAMLCWGSLFPMIKLGYYSFDIDMTSSGSILLFAGLRFLVCGVILIGFISAKDKKLVTPSRYSIMPILWAALFAYVLHYTCTYIGVAHLESSKTAIIKQIGSLFVVCFAFLFRKEDGFSICKVVGGVLGFASIFVINLNGTSFQFDVYDLLVLGASACAVISTLMLKNAYDIFSPMLITAWAQLIGGAALLVIGISLGGRIGRVTLEGLPIFIYICTASCFGYVLWNMLLKYNNMSRLNLIKFTEALWSALFSWLLLCENIFSIKYLLALILVCAGLLIGNSRKHEEHT